MPIGIKGVKMRITDKKTKRPIKIIQFGAGVFLRGFFDWMLQGANDAGIYNGNAVIVRSRTSGADPLEAQNFNYTHLARDGAHNEATIVDSIEGSLNASEDYKGFLALAENPDTDLIVSNTTEAGITYSACEFPESKCPESFPAKLCALLYHRYQKGLSPMLIVPCELIENNADALKEIVLRHASDWKLEKEFFDYIEECSFRNTLVDRIVSGKPSEKIDLGYEDELVNTSEYFYLFVIEGERDERLPFDKLFDGVKYVPSVKPYRTIKVRILNGAHTSMIPFALNRSVPSVGECLKNDEVSAHLAECLAEIVDSLDIDRSETEAYAKSVLERFANPYIYHKCASISLNSVSKFKVRVLPSILDYERKFGKAPSALIRAFAELIKFYKEGTPSDSPDAMEKLKNGTVEQILSDTELWGEDLSRFSSLVKW